jgi:hypothetical protein
MGTNDTETRTDRQQKEVKANKEPSRDGTLDEARDGNAKAPRPDEAIRDGIIEDSRSGGDR